MKHLKSIPKDTEFFAVYAKLRRSVQASGWAAQLVSALTEVGGIFAAALSVLYPIFGTAAIYAAGTIAVIGTAVLEIGLRVTIPQAVDAVLHKRWQGLHLAMSIAVLILGTVLLVASGVLSFANSKQVVATMVEKPDRDTSAVLATDSVHLAELASIKATYQADSTQIAQAAAAQAEAIKAASSGKLNAARRELANVLNKEARTGQSFATQRDRARQKIADQEAEQAEALAIITRTATDEQAAARSRYRSAVEKQGTRKEEQLAALDKEHQAAIGERDSTVSTYGGGLAYFTIVCLLVFLASVILDRIHVKGSDIEETVELSQYDISPSVVTEAWQAFRNRIQYLARNRISLFDEQTPPAPLPTSAAELYDPVEIAKIAANLKVEREGSEEDRVIYLKPKRRAIGFKHQPADEPDTDDNTPESSVPFIAHEKHTKHEHETPELRHLKQRLKFYKKRLGKHEQKAIVQKRNEGKVKTRTAEAIDNNAGHVAKYTSLIQQAEAAAKAKQP